MRAVGALIAVVVLVLLWLVLAHDSAPTAPPARTGDAASGVAPSPPSSSSPRRPREVTEAPADASDSPDGADSAPAPSDGDVVHRVRVEDPAGNPVPGVEVSLHWRRTDGVPVRGRSEGFTNAAGALQIELDEDYVAARHGFGWLGPDLAIEDGRVSAPMQGDETVLVTDAGLPVTVAFFDARTGAGVEGGSAIVRGVQLVAEGALHRAERVGLRRGVWADLSLRLEPPPGWALVGVAAPEAIDFVTETARELRLDVPLWPGREVHVAVQLPDGSRAPGVEWIRVSRSIADGDVVRSTFLGHLWTQDVSETDPHPFGVGAIPTFLRSPVLASALVGGTMYASPRVAPGGEGPLRLVVEVGSNAVRGMAGRIGDGSPDRPRTDMVPLLGELTGSASVDVTVYAHDGSPLADGFVYVPGATSGRTSASGRVRLSGLPEGEHQVVVREPGFPLTARSVVLEPGATTAVRIDAEAASVLTVDVVGDDGRPLPGARVVVRPYGELPFVIVEDGVQRLLPTTDRNGRVVLRGVPRERAELDVSWGVTTRSVSLARDQTRVEVTLPTRRD